MTTAAQRIQIQHSAEQEIMRYARPDPVTGIRPHALWHKHVHNVDLDPMQVLKMQEMDDHRNTVDFSCRRTGKTAVKEMYCLEYLATTPFQEEGIVAPRLQQSQTNLMYHIDAIRRSPILSGWIGYKSGRRQIADTRYQFHNGSKAVCYGIMSQIDGDGLSIGSLEEIDDMPADRLFSRFLPMLGSARRLGVDSSVSFDPQIRITGVYKGADVLTQLIDTGGYHVLPPVDVYLGIELGILNQAFGLRFMLSPRHPRVDICDEHAAADLYGLGQGVYPVDECPWPAHPNTFSYTEAVYRDEIGSLNPTVEKIQTEIAAEADGLLERAASIEPVITGDLQRMAAAVQARMAGLDYRFKGRESLIRKIESKTWRRDVTPARAAANITDVLRYTVLLDGESFVSQYWQLQEQLAASGYQTNKVSNTWRKNAVYKGINTTIIKNGQVFELQFHTEQSFNLKNNELHKLYEEAREISTSTERRAELQRQMVELSRQIPTPPGISTIQTKAGIR